MIENTKTITKQTKAELMEALANMQGTIWNLQWALGGAQQRLDEAAEVKRQLDFEIWELKQEVEKCHRQRNQDVLLLQNFREQVEMAKAARLRDEECINALDRKIEELSFKAYKRTLWGMLTGLPPRKKVAK